MKTLNLISFEKPWFNFYWLLYRWSSNVENCHHWGFRILGVRFDRYVAHDGYAVTWHTFRK